MLSKSIRSCTPPGRDFGRHLAVVFGVLTSVWVALAPAPARAETPRPHDGAATGAAFKGVYLALGPVLSVMHQQGGWDTAFGGEITLAWVDERQTLAGIGISVGGLQLSEREAHRAWADLLAATHIAGVAVGASLGMVADFDLVSPWRVGPQASLWLYAGVMPYARVAYAQATGTVYEVGLKVPLPALEW